MPKPRVPVTMRAVIQRINRKLAQDEEKLKTTRGQRARGDLGNYYILDWNRNCVVHHHIDPESLARDLGVLTQWESVEAE